jgi:hypothetical protein
MDQKMVEALMTAIATNEKVAKAISGTPKIRTAVKV